MMSTSPPLSLGPQYSEASVLALDTLKQLFCHAICNSCTLCRNNQGTLRYGPREGRTMPSPGIEVYNFVIPYETLRGGVNGFNEMVSTTGSFHIKAMEEPEVTK
ncbi:hypothetical protein U1Q18_045077 [Sarracenia purpurea var. burkii]